MKVLRPEAESNQASERERDDAVRPCEVGHVDSLYRLLCILPHERRPDASGLWPPAGSEGRHFALGPLGGTLLKVEIWLDNHPECLSDSLACLWYRRKHGVQIDCLVGKRYAGVLGFRV